MSAVMTGDNVARCPRCSTKDSPHFIYEMLAGRPNILQCCTSQGCKAVFQQKPDGTLVDLEPTLEKIRLGDDLISAVSPDTVADESILNVVDKFESNLNTVKNGFVGNVRSKMQQLEGRAHFIHGELAKRAVADGTLAELVATAKQIIDLVSAHPDGIRKDAAEL